ncbi:succinylglutamate desuccinylase/aspartoacylase family protein [Labrys wisconsinensis]|uniref:Deacylase n=1 Tax=Labrys wisconsinensis TaxID=425677 RepID=A0ABU0J0P0_9HYPH|nr:succinylglutamate desuccinylase/aspartoacylase family protein [Labrys wisconsinensis]MDQ0467826.1 putative deacylase [Labrys wisconsinensis]
MHSGVFHDLDFERDGKARGHVSMPFSVDRSPYFHVRTPVVTVRNGPGPRLLLMAGNHGDEYEGELTLARLARRLEPADIRGAVTILPVANRPAVIAAKRCSPLDAGNLNRAFPGDPLGAPTGRLAWMLEKEIFPRHDVVLDLHSGGTSMAHLPCSLIEKDEDTARHARALDLLQALGMPYGFVAANGPGAPTSMGAARRAGAIGVSGEFGGGGTTTPASMALTARAIDGLMMRLGITAAPLLGEHAPVERPTALLSLARHSQAIYAERRGWWEPAVEPGAAVAAGDLAGWYHDLDDDTAQEQPLRFAEAGIVISCRLHTMSEAGDCLIQVAEPLRA